jgi:hypothetical protein
MIGLLVGSCGRGPETASRRGDTEGPSTGDVEEIEKQLGRTNCVGDLQKWERLYAFAGKRRSVNTGEIDFMYREAGKFGFVAGARRMRIADWYNLDDRQYLLVTGKFDKSERRAVIDYCGPSAPR